MQNLSDWRAYCAAQPGSEETTPFGPAVLVYKVAGKMFALLSIEPPLTINLKCDPQEALILRESFAAVTPGYHMNKKHWNTIALTAELDSELIRSWIDDSYQWVVKGLSKAAQQRLSMQIGKT